LLDAKCILFALAGRALSISGSEGAVISDLNPTDDQPPSAQDDTATTPVAADSAIEAFEALVPEAVPQYSPAKPVDGDAVEALDYGGQESSSATATHQSSDSASGAPVSSAAEGAAASAPQVAALIDTTPAISEEDSTLQDVHTPAGPLAGLASAGQVQEPGTSSETPSVTEPAATRAVIVSDSDTTTVAGSRHASDTHPATAATSTTSNDTSSAPALVELAGKRATATSTSPAPVDDEAKDAVTKAAKMSAKRRRFMLAQSAQQMTLGSNKENAFKPTGTIHGVDCRQFSSFFQVTMGSEDSVIPHSQSQMVSKIRSNVSTALQESGFISKMRALKEIQHFQRKNISDLNRAVMDDVTKVRHWFPSTCDVLSPFYKHQLSNPYTCDVEVIVSVSGHDLEILTNAEEHAHCCKNLLSSTRVDHAPIPRRVQHMEADEKSLVPYQPTHQARGSKHVREYSVTLLKARTVTIFFKYAGAPVAGVPGVPWQVPTRIGPSLGTSIRAAQTHYWTKAKISFHCRETLLEILHLEIRPQPYIPARTFRIYIGQGERKEGLLPLENHEMGSFVKVYPQRTSLLTRADVLSEGKCGMSKRDTPLRFACVDSGAWLTHTTTHEDMAFGALRVGLDASECPQHGRYDTFLCIMDGLGNLVTLWAIHVVVLKTFTLTDTHARQLSIPLHEFAKDVVGDVPGDPKHWQCLVSRFSGVEDGERTDALVHEEMQVDSTGKSAISFKLKDIKHFSTRQCQIRLIDKRSGLCYRSLRILQFAESGVTRLLSGTGIAYDEQALPDQIIDDYHSASSSEEEDLDDILEEIQEPEDDGEIYFYLLVNSEWMRSNAAQRKPAKKTETRIRVNASEALREDLRAVEELERLVGEDQQILPPLWRNVRRKLVALTGEKSFAYSWRPGAQLTVKNERYCLVFKCV